MTFQSTVTRLVDSRGTTEERQLIARWRPQIEDFLQPFSEDILRDNNRLEIGLENTLALKLIVKRAYLPPVRGLVRLADSLGGLAGICARETLRAGYEFHVGLRVQPDRCDREIYVYDRNREFTAFLGRHVKLPPTPEGAQKIAFFGIDEGRGISAYLSTGKNPRVAAVLPVLREKLQRELRYRGLEEHVANLWEHVRLEDDRWVSSKYGLELVKIPLTLATRIISHYRPPYFGYLVPFAEYESIIIAGTADGLGRGWYFTRSRLATPYGSTAGKHPAGNT